MVIGIIHIFQRGSLKHAHHVPDAGCGLQRHLLVLKVGDQIEPVDIVLQPHEWARLSTFANKQVAYGCTKLSPLVRDIADKYQGA